MVPASTLQNNIDRIPKIRMGQQGSTDSVDDHNKRKRGNDDDGDDRAAKKSKADNDPSNVSDGASSNVPAPVERLIPVVDPTNAIGLIINPAPIPADKKRLKMVHFSDLVLNTAANGAAIPGVPKYRASYDDLFDHDSDDIMFEKAGPVMSLFIPGDAQRPDADHHVMICAVRCCQHCLDAPSSKMSSPLTTLDTENIYQGLPFVHSTDRMISWDENGTKAPVFQPHWSIDLLSVFKTPPRARIGYVLFYEGGEGFAQQSMICEPAMCPKCRPNDEMELQMVHRRDLKPIRDGSFSAGRAGPSTSFQCTSQDLFGRDNTYYHAGGPGLRIHVLDGSYDTDVMVCQYQVCSYCGDESRDARTPNGYRLPFAHGKECTENLTTGELDFTPSVHKELDKGGEYKMERKMVRYIERGTERRKRGVISAVCVVASCSVCSSADVQPVKEVITIDDDDDGTDSSLSELTSEESSANDTSTGAAQPNTTNAAPSGGQEDEDDSPADGDNNGDAAVNDFLADDNQEAPETGPVGQSTTVKDATRLGSQAAPQNGTSIASTTGQTQALPQAQQAGPATAVTAPVAPGPTFAFKMCHLKHLDFRSTGVYWNIPPKEAISTDNGGYFVADNWISRKYGGPTYRVTFPDGTQQDVMADRRHRCNTCRKRGPVRSGNSNNGMPFAHRRELVLDPATQIRTFTPMHWDAYGFLRDGTPVATVSATFSRAGPGGATAISTQCETCTSGNCTDCDEADAAEAAAAAA